MRINDLALKKPFVIIGLFLLFSCYMQAQDSAVLIRKGSHIAMETGSILTKQDLSMMIDQDQMEQYQSGRWKMISSIPLYAVSAASLTGFGVLGAATIRYNNERNHYRNEVYDPNDETTWHQYGIPPLLYVYACVPPLLVAAATGWWAVNRTMNGKKLIDGVCRSWNSNRGTEVSLSLVSSPSSVGLMLKF